MIASTLSLIAIAAGAAAAPVSLIQTAVEAVETNVTHQAAAEWYMQNGNYGACGVLSSDSDLVAGLPLEFYSDLGAVSPYCGNYIVVQNNQNNVTKTIRVEDASATNSTLSLSVASWRALDGDSSNLKTVTWRFANSTEAAAAAQSATSPSTNGGSSSWSSMSNDTPSSSSTSSPAPAPTSSKTSSSSSSSSSPSPKPTSSSSSSAKPSSTWSSSSSSKSSEQAQATQQSYSSGSSGSYSYSGQATWYTQGGQAGSCGSVNSDSSYIVAVTSAIMNSGLCGKSVSIKNTATGATATAKIADTCPTCGGQDLDLSTGLFSALSGGDMGQGVFPISWSIN